MRLRTSSNGLTLNVVAGTSAVLFSLDIPKNDADGLMGFHIHKKNLKSGTEYDVQSIRYFEEKVPNPEKGEPRRSYIFPAGCTVGIRTSEER